VAARARSFHVNANLPALRVSSAAPRSFPRPQVHARVCTTPSPRVCVRFFGVHASVRVRTRAPCVCWVASSTCSLASHVSSIMAAEAQLVLRPLFSPLAKVDACAAERCAPACACTRADSGTSRVGRRRRQRRGPAAGGAAHELWQPGGGACGRRCLPRAPAQHAGFGGASQATCAATAPQSGAVAA
jgi:hypothetical protein